MSFKKGEKSVLEVALKYGYTSPDSVTEEIKKKITGLSNNEGVVGLCADMYNGGFDYWIGCMFDNECPEGLDSGKKLMETLR